ncbi:MAG: Ppx/GppA family phosphatase, partial [Bacteroidales bacterium]|nr:Ppx/GppA family phosphatase [Bacteroidales bacterium]
GGNINKIAKLFGKNKIIKYKRLEKTHKKLLEMSVKERMDAYNLRADRADVIAPASEIFLQILRTIKSDYIIAPKIGLADGLIVNMYKKHQQNNESLHEKR